MIVPFFLILSYVLKIFKTRIFQKSFKNYCYIKSNAIQLLERLEFDSAAVYEDGCAIRFLPPVFNQRYLAVHEVLTQLQAIYNIKKVVDIGCAEVALFSHIKRLEGVEEYVGVDIDLSTIQRCSCRVKPLNTEYLVKRCSPLKVSIFNGSAVQPDKSLKDANAVVAVELIEHMYPLELDELPYNIFGLVQPEVAIFTTPNADFNVLFNSPDPNAFRHYDHKFEWSRRQFEDWCNNLILRYPYYEVWISGIGKGPEGTAEFGCCSQIAVFVRNREKTATIDFGVFYKPVCEIQYPYQTKEEKLYDILEFDVYQSIALFSKNEEYLVDGKLQIPLSDILKYISVSCSEEKLKEYLQRSEKDVKCINNQLKLILPPLEDDNSSLSICSGTSENQYTEENNLFCNYEVDPDENWSIDLNDVSKHGNSSELSVDEHHAGVSCDLEGVNCSQMNSQDDKKEKKCNNDFRKSPGENDSEILLSDDSEPIIITVATDLQKKNAVILDQSDTAPKPYKAKLKDTLKLTAASSTCEDFVKNETVINAVLGIGNSPSTVNDKTHKINSSSVLKKVDGILSDNLMSDKYLRNNPDETMPDFGETTSFPSDSDKNKRQQNIETFSVQSKGKESSNSEESKEHDTNDQSSSSLLPRSHSLENVELCSRKSKNFRYSLNIDCEELDCDTDILDMELDICCKGSSIPSLTETCSKAVDSGYPNSNQDMDLDLTPEQVDEIITETESSLEDEESSVDERVEHFQGNPPIVFVDNVENGDVANNNRDGEGNNMEGGQILAEELVFEDLVVVGEEVEAADEHESDDEGLFLSALDVSNETIVPEELSSAEDTVYLFDLPSASSVGSNLVEGNGILNSSMNEFPSWLLGIAIGDENGRGDAGPEDDSSDLVVNRGHDYLYPGDVRASGEPILSDD